MPSFLIVAATLICQLCTADPGSVTRVRFATFNASLAGQQSGEIRSRMEAGVDPQAAAIASIIKHVKPDVLLINEFDFDETGETVRAFLEKYLHRAVGSPESSRRSADAIDYPYTFIAPSNTGIHSGFDLDQDGTVESSEGSAEYARDAWGYGKYPGQFGMLLLSRFPIDRDSIRTFQRFRWVDMPQAMLPRDPKTGESWYGEEVLKSFPLSSKSHWDVPILVHGERIHVLASHPTPPVFDGPEDRNGCRNHDEIRLFLDYVQPDKSAYIEDDRGVKGGLAEGAPFVLMGDLNSDPRDGDGLRAVDKWLASSQVKSNATPRSEGGVEAARLGGANEAHKGESAEDTTDFDDERGPGNLRLDYVLPSASLESVGAGVFWPTKKADATMAAAVAYSDHRLVWVDVEVSARPMPASSKIHP